MMEEILKDIGLTRYGDRLAERKFTYSYFKEHLSVPGNTQQFREYIQTNCGLQMSQVLAICDKVMERMRVETRMPQKPVQPVFASASSKRLSMLLG